MSSPANPAFDGAFETLRWVRGRLPRLAAHAQRLDATLASRRVPRPDWSEIRSTVASSAHLLVEARVRVAVGFDASAAGRWTCEVAPLPETFAARRAGIVAVSRWVPPLGASAPAAEKLFSRRAVLQKMIDDAGPAEPLLVDGDGRVFEGATWNVFAVVDGRLWTPPVGPHVLGGTVRAAVLEAAVASGIPTVVGPLPLDAVWRASELFATNALLPLAPVCSLDGRQLPPPGACLRTLLEVVDVDAEAMA